jgi:hypothetical protein
MRSGAEALALPWPAYVRVRCTGGRVVADPMQGYFDRPVVAADVLEAGPIVTETSDRDHSFTSVKDLIAAIENLIDGWNDAATH